MRGEVYKKRMLEYLASATSIERRTLDASVIFFPLAAEGRLPIGRNSKVTTRMRQWENRGRAGVALWPPPHSARSVSR